MSQSQQVATGFVPGDDILVSLTGGGEGTSVVNRAFFFTVERKLDGGFVGVQKTGGVLRPNLPTLNLDATGGPEDRPPTPDVNRMIELIQLNGPEEAAELAQLQRDYLVELEGYRQAGIKPLPEALGDAAFAFVLAHNSDVKREDGTHFVLKRTGIMVRVPPRPSPETLVLFTVQAVPVWG